MASATSSHFSERFVNFVLTTHVQHPISSLQETEMISSPLGARVRVVCPSHDRPIDTIYRKENWVHLLRFWVCVARSFVMWQQYWIQKLVNNSQSSLQLQLCGELLVSNLSFFISYNIYICKFLSLCLTLNVVIKSWLSNVSVLWGTITLIKQRYQNIIT